MRDDAAFFQVKSKEGPLSPSLVADGAADDEQPWFAAAVVLLATGVSGGQTSSRRRRGLAVPLTLPVERS